MFNWLSKLLKWRRNNMVITKGKQIQFIPYKGVYVIARQWNDQTILTILNGTSQAVTLPLDRYAEVIGNHQEAKDVFSGRKVKLGSELQLKARDTKVIELSM